MAPYKLEDNIREKLENREIKPSANAWRKLELTLDTEQPKKKNMIFYYAAASFMGLLIAVSVFYSNNNSEGNNQIVEENIREHQTDVPAKIIPNKINTEEITSEKKQSERLKIEKKQPPIKNEVRQFLPKKSAIDKNVEYTKALTSVLKEEIKKSTIKENRIISEEEKLINNKVDEVVASVKKLRENNIEATATEVEKLLSSARRDIQTQQIISNPKVDATALLQDVEWELDKSFRDKVFDALGEGFQKVRTAVSERND